MPIYRSQTSHLNTIEESKKELAPKFGKLKSKKLNHQFMKQELNEELGMEEMQTPLLQDYNEMEDLERGKTKN